MHLSFNVIGALIFGIGGFILFTILPDFASSSISAVEISVFHTIFNVSNTLILFPFANQLVKLSGVLVKEKESSEEKPENTEEAEVLKHLDERIFESPAFAIETAALEVVRMGQLALENVKTGMNAVLSGNTEDVEHVYKTEMTINNMEKMLTEYLIKIDNLSLTEHQKLIVNNLFYSINDIERIGDHAENLAESAEYMTNHNLKFSETGIQDLETIGTTVLNSFSYAIEARKSSDMEAVRKVSRYEDEVDNLEEELREKHIERLSSGRGAPLSGVLFLDIISNLERISDHSYNLAGYIKNEI